MLLYYIKRIVPQSLKYRLKPLLDKLKFHFLCLFPIANNRVMFLCRFGNLWSCNPKALADYMNEEGNWDIHVGLTKETDKYNGVKCHKIPSISYYYYLLTSRFFVTNDRITPSTNPLKRHGQIYIYTTHGGAGIKKINVNTSNKNILYNQLNACIDYILSNSAQKDKIIRDGYGFQQQIFHIGMPRNDIFYLPQCRKQEIKSLVYKKLGLTSEEHFVLYAPTFRYGANGNKELYNIDVPRILNSLANRFGGKWKIVIHKHFALNSAIHDMYDYANSAIIDGLVVEDVQELLVAADVLITDYSSIAMDFCLTGRPIFQFFVDGFNWKNLCMMNPMELPFPYSENNEQLCKLIELFNEKEYSEKLLCFQSNVLQLHDDGHACERLTKWMRTQV